MTRLSYLIYCWTTALRYHAPRRLTKAGLLASGGLVLAGAIGSDLDQSVAFQGFAILLCLLGVAAASAPFFRGKFEVCRALPRLASVGQPFKYVVQVRNRSPRSYRGLDLLEDLADARPTFQEFAEFVRPSTNMRAFRLAPTARPRLEQRKANVSSGALSELRPNAVATAEIQLVPLRRGPLRFRGITLARPDPLGLVRSFVRIPLPQTVLVLPERHPVPELAFPGARQYQPGGVALASSIGESEEFVSLRDYRPGDPQRRIHWRSWARAGRPIVKEYQDEFFVRHGLVLDTFVRQGQEDAFEDAVSVAASFACTLQTQDSLLDLLFVGNKALAVAAGRGLADSEQILEVLASVQPNREPGFDGLQELVLRHAPLLGSCIGVFVQWDEPRRELVQRLRAMGLPMLALVVIDARSSRQTPELSSEAGHGQVHVLRAGHIRHDLQALNFSAL